MGMHLLTSLNCKFTGVVILGTDSQDLVKATKNQHPPAGHYILDKIHDAAEKLHTKQDGLANRQVRQQVTRGQQAEDQSQEGSNRPAAHMGPWPS